MQIHHGLYNSPHCPLAGVAVLRLYIPGILLRDAINSQLFTEAATSTHHVQFTSSNWLYHRSPSASVTQTAAGMPSTSASAVQGSPRESLHPVSHTYAGVPSHLEDLQTLAEHTRDGTGLSSSVEASLGAVAVTEPSAYEAYSSLVDLASRTLLFPEMLGLTLTPLSNFQGLVLPVKSGETQHTQQHEFADATGHRQEDPLREFAVELPPRSHQHSTIERSRHRAEATRPLRDYHQQQQGEWLQERLQAASPMLDAADSRSTNVYNTNHNLSNVQRLQSQSWWDVEKELGQPGVPYRARSRGAAGKTSSVPMFIPSPAALPRNKHGVQRPLRLPHERAMLGGFEKVAQTDPADPTFCNIDATLPYICFSAINCPSPPAGSKYLYQCVTTMPGLLSMPGVCRLPCDSSANAEISCPLGQVCALTGSDESMCVDVCPPDGLPPCTRKTCGVLQRCTRNFCRTPAASIEPSLCTPALRRIDMDYFCAGAATLSMQS